MSRHAVLIVLAAMFLIAGGPALAGAEVTIMGYYPVYGPGDTLAHAGLIRATPVNAVGAFLYSIDGQGIIRAQVAPSLMGLAQQRDIKVYALIHNTDSSGFSRWAATQILTNPTVRARALDNMVRVVQAGGYDGIHVDLENVNPVERVHLTGFMGELTARLQPLGYEVGIAVPAKTADSPTNSWSGAFDYAALGRIVDHIAIMAYDEHWSGGHPGPVASLPWVTAVARYASSVIPPQKVLLGIATYGYDWPAGGSGGRALSSPRAASLAADVGATIQWDSRANVPFFRYWSSGQARIVYYENSYSTDLKLRLVRQLSLGGVAVWRLGTEDPAIWPLMQALRNSYTVSAPAGGTIPVSGGSQTYTVQRGDTVSLLAGRFGVSVDSIVRVNGLSNPDLLYVGQRLLIPAVAQQPPRIHSVSPGETLWLIASRYGTTWQAIYQASGLSTTVIYPGQRLIIPGGASAPPPPRIHVVSRGESLWIIASSYGTTWQAIYQASNLSSTVIHPGQRLIIP